MPYTYDYSRPMVTVDLVVFAPDKDRNWHVLLIERGKAPFKGQMAIPGGFLNDDEEGHNGALRELYEETGYRHNVRPSFLMLCDLPDRDPRGRVVGLAYLAFLDRLVPVKGGDDAANAKWVSVADAMVSDLAFDHNNTLLFASLRIKGHEDSLSLKALLADGKITPVSFNG